MTVPFRDRMHDRLVQDLIGPLTEDESFPDRPTQRYSTGILYPARSQIQPEEDGDGGLAINETEDAAGEPDSSVSLNAALKPSVAGLSFAVRPEEQGQDSSIRVDVNCARYEPFYVDNEGKELVETSQPDRSKERWRRVPLGCTLEVPLVRGETRRDLSAEGIPGLELYLLVSPQTDLLTATVALSNKLQRGQTRTYDEQQHFFQVNVSVHPGANCSFAPRPSIKSTNDDDGRTATLIYRDVVEYAVGHTCSAASALDSNGAATLVQTEWLPGVIVPSVSDRGDEEFERLRTDADPRPLEAGWLASASAPEVSEALEKLVAAYREWIAKQDRRVSELPPSLRSQANLHLTRCSAGADRMSEGIAKIREDSKVLQAFQFSQEAMDRQFGWSRSGQRLIWHPFQLAFQLLVLPSLADGEHLDRGTMDLLWFPTGGGKTEAYLGLTAFIILLRRLRAKNDDQHKGVAVLMRYTLRLLTIQQFQRAAAMIFACELIRRRGEAPGDGTPGLGSSPIGLGLWVGAGATPLTLLGAITRGADDQASAEQLQKCPCCQGDLQWKISPQESLVECQSDPTTCDLAGQPLPLWTIDEEVYREAPSLLIGTVDKFAQIVRNMNTRVLFGGGTNSSPPDLIIQDELHLISGPLGSMAGLYETAIDELCRRGQTKPKIIGSTATIRRAQEQIRALFDRETYQFPAPGLDASNSGFAVVDYDAPGRLYLGISTVGRSATYMLQALVAALLQGASEFPSGSPERDHYWTQVGYFNSLKELGRGLVLMQDDVPISVEQYAARRGEAPREVSSPAELTSRVPTYEIRDMLERLKKESDEPGAVDLLLASNMISVGMDIPRLGLMVVNAQPKTLSEYIQATSRVGRGNVPGIVVTMYNSMRARDRAHYETFETWHRSLYRDVEATSVTPFASRAQDKALHAILVALVRHTVAGMDRRPTLDDLHRVSAEQIATLIEERVARVDPAEAQSVASRLKRLLDEWCSRPDLEAFWDDFGKRRSLLMSAEQFAAKADVDPGADPEGAQRALWPTPNSMREVEPGTPFVLRGALRTEVTSDA